MQKLRSDNLNFLTLIWAWDKHEIQKLGQRVEGEERVPLSWFIWQLMPSSLYLSLLCSQRLGTMILQKWHRHGAERVEEIIMGSWPQMEVLNDPAMTTGCLGDRPLALALIKSFCTMFLLSCWICINVSGIHFVLLRVFQGHMIESGSHGLPRGEGNQPNDPDFI